MLRDFLIKQLAKQVRSAAMAKAQRGTNPLQPTRLAQHQARPRLTHRTFLFGFIFLAVLVMGERVLDLFGHANSPPERSLVRQVQAELPGNSRPPTPTSTPAAESAPTAANVPAAAPTTAAPAAAPAAPATASAASSAAATSTPPAMSAPPPAPPTRQTGEARELTPAELAVLQQLSQRRNQLEARESALQQRENLLKATEKRLDEKLKEMESLRTTLTRLLGQANEQQVAEVENLVRIYEAMKPTEAARILAQLELPILLQVVRQMKPARSAPILAEMDPAKAMEITTALTRKNELPSAENLP